MFNPTAKYSAMVGIAVIALLFQTACSQSQITLTLGLVDTAVETVLNAAAPQDAALVNPYLTGVTDAVSYATTEWATADSAALKFTKIAAQFALIAQPDLPPGTPATVIADAGLVTKAVETFLASIETTTAAITATPAGAQAFFAPAASAKAPKLSRGDKQAIPKIVAKNALLKARLKASRGK
jgi:hypothetical protein